MSFRLYYTICLLLFSLLFCSTTQAQLQYPLDLTATEEGTFYVADRKLPGIWKVSEGKFSVFFQGEKTFRTPLNAVRCVAIAADGSLLAGDSATREVYKFDQDQKPQPLTRGKIGIPSALLIDGDTVFVSDLELQRIWSFPLAGGEPKEVAVIAGVRGLAKHPDGKLLCLTTLEDPLRTIGEDGTVASILKGRPFQMPHHIVVVGDMVYVADNYANTVWKVNLTGDALAEPFFAGEPLQKPVGLGLFKEELLVADPHAQKIFRIDLSGKINEIPFME